MWISVVTFVTNRLYLFKFFTRSFYLNGPKVSVRIRVDLNDSTIYQLLFDAGLSSVALYPLQLLRGGRCDKTCRT